MDTITVNIYDVALEVRGEYSRETGQELYGDSNAPGNEGFDAKEILTEDGTDIYPLLSMLYMKNGQKFINHIEEVCLVNIGV